jgi:hypothetical protein
MPPPAAEIGRERDSVAGAAAAGGDRTLGSSQSRHAQRGGDPELGMPTYYRHLVRLACRA